MKNLLAITILGSNMKNSSMLLILIFTLLVTIETKAQTTPEPCKLGITNAPVLRGLKLGMLPKVVEKTIGVKVTLTDYKPYFADEIIPEVKEFRYSGKSKNAPTPKELEGIDFLALTFYNNSLYQITVTYAAPKVAWKDNDEFVSYLSEKFDLPKNAWTEQNTYLSCDGFTVLTKIDVDNRPMLGVTNRKISTLVLAKEAQLLQKYKSKRRVIEIQNEKGFKP